MPRSRRVRFLTSLFLFALYAVAAFAAARFFVQTVRLEGAGPGALLAVLLLTGGLALVWRGAVNLRDSARRLRR